MQGLGHFWRALGSMWRDPLTSKVVTGIGSDIRVIDPSIYGWLKTVEVEQGRSTSEPTISFESFVNDSSLIFIYARLEVSQGYLVCDAVAVQFNKENRSDPNWSTRNLAKRRVIHLKRAQFKELPSASIKDLKTIISYLIDIVPLPIE